MNKIYLKISFKSPSKPYHEFPIHETLPFKLKSTLTDRLQPDKYEYNNLLLLDAVDDDDDDDDDGFDEELNK